MMLKSWARFSPVTKSNILLRCLLDSSVSTYFANIRYPRFHSSFHHFGSLFPFPWHYLQSVSAQLQELSFCYLLFTWLEESWCDIIPERAAQCCKVDSHRFNLLSYILSPELTLPPKLV